MTTGFEIEALPGDEGFRLVGELDLLTVSALREALSTRAGDDVVLDVRGLTFLDSSGGALLIEYTRNGASIRIVNASEAVARALQLMGIDRHPGIELTRATVL